MAVVKPVGSLVVHNIGRLLSMVPGSDPWGIRNASVMIRDGIVEWVGPEAHLDRHDCAGLVSLDAAGGLVTPGMVECHTHLVFAGSRSDEFEARGSGASYQNIAHGGGGIMRTVQATRAASSEELAALALPRIADFLRRGVTTIEIKSGYGLELSTELKILRVIRDLDNATPVDLVPTFLGAHAIPPEGSLDRSKWVDAMVVEWIPAVASAGLARFCDVFCDEMAFTPDEAAAILRAGIVYGLRPKIHADQLSTSGGSEVAADVGAVSADHLDWALPEACLRMAASGTVGVLLPGCLIGLGKGRIPDIRAMKAAGMRIALSTDYNPGSSPTRDLPLMGTLAMAWLGLSLEDTWAGVTTCAAAALGLDDSIGRIQPGFVGDLAIWNGDDPRAPFYTFGGSVPRDVVKRGCVIGCGGGT
jgi:imidazolonepropionase